MTSDCMTCLRCCWFIPLPLYC